MVRYKNQSTHLEEIDILSDRNTIQKQDPEKMKTKYWNICQFAIKAYWLYRNWDGTLMPETVNYDYLCVY